MKEWLLEEAAREVAAWNRERTMRRVLALSVLPSPPFPLQSCIPSPPSEASSTPACTKPCRPAAYSHPEEPLLPSVPPGRLCQLAYRGGCGAGMEARGTGRPDPFLQRQAHYQPWLRMSASRMAAAASAASYSAVWYTADGGGCRVRRQWRRFAQLQRVGAGSSWSLARRSFAGSMHRILFCEQNASIDQG
jgi:hypothetical protein